MGNAIDVFKTAAPSLAGVVARASIVQRLREIKAPGKWLSGASGSGKSTLASQYAASSGKQVLWYRLDARDDDPAFFYSSFIGMLEKNGIETGDIPPFTKENHAQEAAFGARFFASALASPPEPFVLVVDDGHLIAADARRIALAQLALLATTSREILFVSEQTAPFEFFDAIASRRLALCNDLRLEFDADECAAMGDAARVHGIDGVELATLTGGHAGALVLACEFLRDSSTTREEARAVVDRIHQHFLDKLLAGMPEARRDLLLRISFASQFAAPLAFALVGARAAEELRALQERALLRHVSTPAGDVYETHGLIRRGVRSSLRSRLGDAAARSFALDTAEFLCSNGYEEDAFAAFVEHDEPARAADVLQSLATRYAKNGEVRLLARSLSRLSEEVLTQRPWLTFLAGRTLQAIDEQEARAWFERSYTSFAAVADFAGMRIAAASVVIAYVVEYGDIRGLDTWLERHAEAGGTRTIAPDCAYETTLCMGVICAAGAAGAYPSGLDSDVVVSRLQCLLESDSAWLSPEQRVDAARLLVDHAYIFGSAEQAQAMVLATRARVQTSGVSALQRGRWYLSAANAYMSDGDPTAGEEYLRQASALALESGSKTLAFDLGMVGVNAAQKRGDHDGAHEALREIESLAVDAAPAQRAEYARHTARVLLARRHTQEGFRWAQEAMRAAVLAGYTGSNLRAFQLECVHGLAANDRLDEALSLAREMTEGLDGAQLKFGTAIGDCLEFLATGAINPAWLQSGLRCAADAGFVHLLSRAGDCLPRVCDAALAAGIEPQFVRRLIAVQRLQPPQGAGAQWPWPVRVRTLGGFELEINGERYRPTHKSQDKPLDLLKLLVCCQAMGRAAVDRQWIGERLWPDSDSPNARKSLDMTLSRLRKLLGEDEFVPSIDSRLQLSPQHVWTDVAPLVRALGRVGAHRDRVAQGRAVQQAAAIADVSAVLEHLRGPFLPDEEAVWLLAGREAVASAVRSALLAAESLFAGREDPQLIPALQRAWEADATSEDLARALMRSLIRSKQSSEALRVYRRLREMLSIVLGVTPSAETEKLKEQIYAEADADTASSTTISRQ